MTSDKHIRKLNTELNESSYIIKQEKKNRNKAVKNMQQKQNEQNTTERNSVGK